MTGQIRVALVGIGNCASALVQGVHYYANQPNQIVGISNLELGGYQLRNIEFSAAFDVNELKVGRDLSKGIFAHPNCTAKFTDVPHLGVEIVAGPVLDGLGNRLAEKVRVTDAESNVADVLRQARTDVVVNYLPVGSELATEFYADAALDAGCAFINAIPVFLAQNDMWRQRFRRQGLPLIGDDVKSQVGATMVHRVLTQMLSDRGLTLDHTYQINVGGNMDFWNMLDETRLESKRKSKSQAVLDVANRGEGMDWDKIHIGPSDHVSWLGDKKVAFIRLEGSGFGGLPFEIELRMQVWDSPNSAGIVIDAIRYAKIAKDRGLGGPIEPVCAWLMKAPPKPMTDQEALQETKRFLEDLIEEGLPQ